MYHGDDGSGPQALRRRERSQPRQRSSKEQAQIDQAKALLMERNGMTEAEAHRYIQNAAWITEPALQRRRR